jgi:hypothetical protein
MGDRTKRKGRAPDHVPTPRPAALPANSGSGYPILCLRHLQDEFGIDNLDPDHCREFLRKWHKRAVLTWTDLIQHPKHGLGSENLPKSKFKPAIPEQLEQAKYMFFRHSGNMPFAGFRSGDVFHVLWIEAKYNTLYEH